MRVVIAGGGTTGHLSPGIAVGKVLRDHGAEILFVGTPSGPEARIVPNEGFAFMPVKVIGRGPGTLSVRNAKAALTVTRATMHCYAILRRFRADVVLGTGGYVSLPVAFAGRLMKLPLVVHEQNSVPGLANRVAARFAWRVAVSFPQSEGRFGSKAVLTGNPVRPEIAEMDKPALRPQAIEHFALNPDLKTLLVFGGSQGAVRINEAAFGAFDKWRRLKMQVLHLTGPRNFEPAKKMLAQLQKPDDTLVWRLIPYSDRMDLAYTVADLAVCRSGASTIAELAASALPAILVPLPISLDDDQRHNAEAIVKAGGGIIVPDSELNGDAMASKVTETLFDKAVLAAMSGAIRMFFRPDAGRLLAGLVEQAVAK